MQRCPYCQGEVDPTTQTCRQCGRVPFVDMSPTAPQPPPPPPRPTCYCTACGDALPDGARFCGRCGQPVNQTDSFTTHTLVDGGTLAGNAQQPAPMPTPAPQPQPPPRQDPYGAAQQQRQFTPLTEPAPPLQFIPGLQPPAGTGPSDLYPPPEEPKGMSSRGIISLLLIGLAIVTIISAYLITQAKSTGPSPSPTATPVIYPTNTPLPAPTDTPQPTEQPSDTPTTGPAPTDTPGATTTPAPTDTPSTQDTPTPGTTPSGSPTPETSPTQAPTQQTTPSDVPSQEPTPGP
jgi:hypothetical protein